MDPNFNNRNPVAGRDGISADDWTRAQRALEAQATNGRPGDMDIPGLGRLHADIEDDTTDRKVATHNESDADKYDYSLPSGDSSDPSPGSLRDKFYHALILPDESLPGTYPYVDESMGENPLTSPVIFRVENEDDSGYDWKMSIAHLIPVGHDEDFDQDVLIDANLDGANLVFSVKTAHREPRMHLTGWEDTDDITVDLTPLITGGLTIEGDEVWIHTETAGDPPVVTVSHILASEETDYIAYVTGLSLDGTTLSWSSESLGLDENGHALNTATEEGGSFDLTDLTGVQSVTGDEEWIHVDDGDPDNPVVSHIGPSDAAQSIDYSSVSLDGATLSWTSNTTHFDEKGHEINSEAGDGGSVDLSGLIGFTADEVWIHIDDTDPTAPVIRHIGPDADTLAIIPLVNATVDAGTEGTTGPTLTLKTPTVKLDEKGHATYDGETTRFEDDTIHIPQIFTDFADVDISDAQDQDVLVYQTTGSHWINVNKGSDYQVLAVKAGGTVGFDWVRAHA